MAKRLSKIEFSVCYFSPTTYEGMHLHTLVSEIIKYCCVTKSLGFMSLYYIICVYDLHVNEVWNFEHKFGIILLIFSKVSLSTYGRSDPSQSLGGDIP